jgi:YhcN/YlaJ family sporulation lipoprotein
MRRKSVGILALVLVFALMFTACAARRPLETPIQPRGNTTGQYNNNRGNSLGNNTGMGPSSNNPTDTGYGMDGNGNPSYYGGYGGYGGYNNGMYGGYGNDYRNIGGTNTSPNYGINNTGNNTTQANRLSRICETVPGVDNATVVVSGNTAYVGVDTDGDLTGRNIAYGTANDLSAVKSQCAQKVRSANPQIQTVYVSTDTNFFERLRKVGNGTRNGTMTNNFRNELNELVRGLTPER